MQKQKYSDKHFNFARLSRNGNNWNISDFFLFFEGIKIIDIRHFVHFIGLEKN